LGLDLEAKRTEEDVIWGLIVLEVVIARLGVTAELGQDIMGFETKQVVTALERDKVCKISNVLLLELKKDIKGREEILLFPLYFLLATRVKATSSASGTLTTILTSEKCIRKTINSSHNFHKSRSIRLR